MRIEVVVPVIPSFLEPLPKSAAERRRERRAKEREIMYWPDRIGGYSEKDWLDLKRRQGGLCAHCKRDDGRRLRRVRKVPPHMGGTNYIGNIIGLCDSCKDWAHSKCYSQLRYLVRAMELRVERQGGFKTAGRAFPFRRHQRVKALAIKKGFLRETGEPYFTSDPDACVCTRGQDPHLRGSEVCKEAS